MTLEEKFQDFMKTKAIKIDVQKAYDIISSKSYHVFGQKISSNEAQLILDQHDALKELQSQLLSLEIDIDNTSDDIIRDLQIVNAERVTLSYESTYFEVWVDELNLNEDDYHSLSNPVYKFNYEVKS